MKTTKRKIGNLKMNIPFMGRINKPIWIYVQNNYWTGDEPKWVLNINFRKDEQYLLSMFAMAFQKSGFFKNYFPDTQLVNIDLTDKLPEDSKGYGNKWVKSYYKLFITIDPKDTDIEDFIDEFNGILKRSVTTMKLDLDNLDMDSYKSEVVADLI